MGLDGVELIMEVEDEFGIKIPDNEASKVVTVADLYVLVCRLTEAGPGLPRSLSLEELQRAFAEVGLHQTLSDVDLLEQQIPFEKRHLLWETLSRRTRQKLPPLQSPVPGKVWLALLIGGALLGVLAGVLGAIAGAIVGFLIAWMIADWAKARYPVFPPHCRTVWELRQFLVHDPSATQVWTKLVAIISEQLGLKPQDITPASRFVEDFNVD